MRTQPHTCIKEIQSEPRNDRCKIFLYKGPTQGPASITGHDWPENYPEGTSRGILWYASMSNQFFLFLETLQSYRSPVVPTASALPLTYNSVRISFSVGKLKDMLPLMSWSTL